MTCGNVEALLDKKVRSEGTGHMAAPELSLTGRRDPEPQDMWQCVVAHLAPCLDLKHVRGGN
jgi:hypothetical protein